MKKAIKLILKYQRNNEIATKATTATTITKTIAINSASGKAIWRIYICIYVFFLFFFLWGDGGRGWWAELIYSAYSIFYILLLIWSTINILSVVFTYFVVWLRNKKKLSL